MSRAPAWALPLLIGLLLALPAARPPREERARAPGLKRGSARSAVRTDSEERRLTAIREAITAGRIDEARALLRSIVPSRLPPGREEELAYLRAVLASDGAAHEAALLEYVKTYPRGAHRRAAALDLAKIRYAQGDYREADNLLALFSPGVERDALGREGLVWRGFAQLGRNDPTGALQLLQSARKDLDGTSEEEAYYYAVAQSALRANRPGEAEGALRVILARHAQGPYAPQALYAMGLCLEMMGRAADAAAVFRQVVQRFPATYEATRARDRGIRAAPGPTGMMSIGGFAIQVGAFSRREVAETLARDLRLSGIGDVSVNQSRETPTIFQVRAGAFATRDEARALGERLRRERGFSYTIVPR